ncbi:MAG TPA: T9SS type A sorting domain-containing protein, partial [Candidatus Deferrimicrobium sp.]|nr:T9SS type A sorting domain-containing protein [Candidatus Deferrimicrobium sp.]
CSTYYDTATASVYPEPGRPHALPLYARMLDTISTITAGPVTGDFGFTDTQLVAVGYPISTDSGRVTMYQVRDGNRDGLADAFPDELITFGIPIALSFGDTLFVLADNGLIYAKPGLLDAFRRVDSLPAEQFHGICRVADKLLVMTGDSLQSLLYCIDGDPTDSIELGGYYNFGPIVVDVDRDDVPEVVAFGPDGHAIFVSIDTTSSPVSMSILRRRETDFHVTTNPVAADLDRDGYPDIVIGGTNAIYAFDRTLTLLTDFPMAAGDRFLDDDVIAAPVVADIDRGGPPEVVFPTLVGNVYSFGDDLSNGFPLSGGERAAGAAVILSDSSGGKLGYLGSDGWFYLWEVDKDTSTDYWPMGGHDAAGTFAFDQSRLSEPTPIAELLPDERFYNYPNPVTDGSTVIRYYLGEDAAGVRIKLFDLSGTRVAELHGATAGGLDHEQVWDCSHVTPGVYRCILEADFGGRTETAFTDIAVIR